jgi:Tfp pilus assembly protein PilN
MQLLLRDPAYTDRLAAFLRSLGQTALVNGPDLVELVADNSDVARAEVQIYLRVWRVLYPEAEVEVQNGD